MHESPMPGDEPRRTRMRWNPRYSNPFFAGLVVIAGEFHPIPFRTRPLKPPAPMVLRVNTRESRSPPGLQKTDHSKSRHHILRSATARRRTHRKQKAPCSRAGLFVCLSADCSAVVRSTTKAGAVLARNRTRSTDRRASSHSLLRLVADPACRRFWDPDAACSGTRPR